MVKITQGQSDTIANIANKHWEAINPFVLAQNRYSVYSLISRIENKRSLHLAAGTNDRANFYNDLLNNDHELLKQIILCEPLQFEDLIIQIETLHQQYGLISSSSQETNFGYELLNDVFQYENWRNSLKSFELFELLDIQVCPYCNLDLVWQDQLRGLTIVSYDHFYDKSSYPYLCLSFYNLIPACRPCNENYKHALKFRIDSHFHPYLDYYNRMDTFNNNYTDDETEYEVTIEHSPTDLKSINYNTAFGLLNRYNLKNHKKHAKLVYNITQRYPPSAKAKLVTDWGVVNINQVEQKICAQEEIPFQENEILNQQFGKLRRDFALKGNLVSRANTLLIQGV